MKRYTNGKYQIILKSERRQRKRKSETKCNTMQLKGMHAQINKHTKAVNFIMM